MKKFLALMAAVAMMAPVVSFAADAVSEDETVDINLFLRAELEESLKVVISHADMVVNPLLPNEGTIHLDGGDVEKIDTNASRANAPACHNDVGAISYTGVASCVSDATGAGKASFAVTYGYEVELSGAGTITLDLALNSVAPAADVHFDASEISSPDATVGGTATAISIEGLVHEDAGVINWEGDMLFDAGASFEDNIVVDISLI